MSNVQIILKALSRVMGCGWDLKCCWTPYYFKMMFIIFWHHLSTKAWIILCMRPTNERRHYNVTLSLIGWAHSRNGPCKSMGQWVKQTALVHIMFKTFLEENILRNWHVVLWHYQVTIWVFPDRKVAFRCSAGESWCLSHFAEYSQFWNIAHLKNYLHCLH